MITYEGLLAMMTVYEMEAAIEKFNNDITEIDKAIAEQESDSIAELLSVRKEALEELVSDLEKELKKRKG